MALTPAQRRALQLRHLAQIARAEAELRVAVLATLAALAAVYADPDAGPVEESAAQTAAESDVNNSWLLLLALLFRKRYDDAGGDASLATSSYREYQDRARPQLLGVLAEVATGGDPETLATRVTRTEVIRAYNGGAFRGLAQHPEGLTKSWLSLRDLKVRPTHREADGQSIPLTQKFVVGGHACDYPGDPSLPASEACNCRCVLTLESDLNPVVASIGAEMTDLPNGWEGIMAPLDRKTGDTRYLATPVDGVRARMMPVSFTLKHVTENDDTPIGTVEEYKVVQIDGVEGDFLWGAGRLDLGSVDGAEYARRLHEGFADTGSITPDEVTFEQRFMDPSGAFVDIEKATEIAKDGPDEGYLVIKEGYSVVNVMADWRLANFSAVSIPAFDEARIGPVYGYQTPAEVAAARDPLVKLLAYEGDDEADLAGFAREILAAHRAESGLAADSLHSDAVVAAVGGQIFNKAFFDVNAVKLDGPTAFQVLPSGQVLGHIALFDSCYMMMGTNGKQGCIKPPQDADFSRFQSHAAWFGGDDTMPVGMITFGEGHRTAGSLRASQELYANIATGAAKVVVGMDQWGYFVTGEVLEQFADRAYDLLLSPLSGHWEPDMDRRGKLTMIAAHVVVTQGYDVPRVAASFGADGEIDAVQFAGPAPKIAPDLQAALRAKLALRALALR